MRTQARGNSGVNKSKSISGVGKLPDWEVMFAELAEKQEPDGGFLTMVEWGELTGRGADYLRKRFHAAKKVGRLEVGTVKREALSGRSCSVFAYRILSEKKV